MLMITQFAKIHQYDDRHTYKDAWQLWLKREEEIIERELSRLNQLGYKGDVIDKMFKAGRYYFREKTIVKKDEENNTKEEVKEVKEKKRDYIVMNPEVIQAMDAHLTEIMKQPNFKPANGYVQFCEQQIDLLRREIIRLTAPTANNVTITKEKLAEKIKKTYKNRYYMFKQ